LLDVSVSFNTQELSWQDLSNINMVPLHSSATSVKDLLPIVSYLSYITFPYHLLLNAILPYRLLTDQPKFIILLPTLSNRLKSVVTQSHYNITRYRKVQLVIPSSVTHPTSLYCFSKLIIKN
jgi:hypothetical protein